MFSFAIGGAFAGLPFTFLAARGGIQTAIDHEMKHSETGCSVVVDRHFKHGSAIVFAGGDLPGRQQFLQGEVVGACRLVIPQRRAERPAMRFRLSSDRRLWRA